MITGTGQYVDDVKLVNMAYMAVLRSPHGHARIRDIRTDAARRALGVLAVLTGSDLKDRLGLVPVAAQLPDMKVPKHYALAVDKVRFVGEPVAAVVAESRYAASDALSLIEVDYEPLPAVIDIEKAVQADAPVLHEELAGEKNETGDANVAYRWSLGGGSAGGAFADPRFPLSGRRGNQRRPPAPMEPQRVPPAS